MSRSEIRDPIAQVARKMEPEIRAMARGEIAQASGGMDGAFARDVTTAGEDDDGNAITTVGFAIGVSAIGGPDGIGVGATTL